MSIVRFSEQGQIIRDNVNLTGFFIHATDKLIEFGCRSTAWVDYFTFQSTSKQYFITVKKNKIEVADIDSFLFSTKFVDKVKAFIDN